MKNLLPPFTLFILTSIISLPLAAQDSQSALTSLQKHWAINNYKLEGDEQEEAFIQLISEADGFAKEYPSNAPVLIWRGIIKSTFAGVSGGLGALKYAKAAKADLEAAIELEPEALDGSAYTSLGTLYYNVPGWPIGFGSDKKAEVFLLKALEINPDGIDSNYFYADYLIGEKRYMEAKDYLRRARKAAPRPGREIAYSGRLKEIDAAIESISKR